MPGATLSDSTVATVPSANLSSSLTDATSTDVIGTSDIDPPVSNGNGSTRSSPVAKLRHEPVAEYDDEEALRLIAKTGSFCLDLETRGLDVHAEGFGVGLYILGVRNRTFLFRRPPTWLPVALQDPDTRVRIFNAAFDLKCLIGALDIKKVANVRDLMLDELLVSTQRRGVRHTLDATLQRRLGLKVKKEIDHDNVDWCGYLTPEMTDYAIHDVAWMDDLGDELDRLVAQTEQQRAAQIEHDAVFGTACMAYNGIPIDRDALGLTALDWAEEMVHWRGRLRERWPEVKNFDSTYQLQKAILAHEGVSINTTRREVIEQLAPSYESLDWLARYRHGAKRLSVWSYGKQKGKPARVFTQRYLHRRTGRVYPDWFQIGTDTCRYACANPPFQQGPREWHFRRIVRARPGWKILSVDYGQIEVVAAAAWSRDANLIRVLREGGQSGDFHRTNVAAILGVDPADVTSGQRQLGKAVTFHSLFGGGPTGLVEYAKKFGVHMTEHEAGQIQRRFFEKYPGLMRLRIQAKGLIPYDKPPAMLEVRNLVNMRRILTGDKVKPTTYLNTVIQSSAGHGLKAGMARLMRAGLARYLIMQVHDELVMEVPEDKADEIKDLTIACMIAGMKEVLGRDMPVTVDPVIGSTWS